jgi:hypothetical protein
MTFFKIKTCLKQPERFLSGSFSSSNPYGSLGRQGE